MLLASPVLPLTFDGSEKAFLLAPRSILLMLDIGGSVSCESQRIHFIPTFCMPSKPRYGRIVTGVPNGTVWASQMTSLLYMRMHPCETSLPMLDGSFVP